VSVADYRVTSSSIPQVNHDLVRLELTVDEVIQFILIRGDFLEGTKLTLHVRDRDTPAIRVVKHSDIELSLVKCDVRFS
jgi:hypothetical protein